MRFHRSAIGLLYENNARNNAPRIREYEERLGHKIGLMLTARTWRSRGREPRSDGKFVRMQLGTGTEKMWDESQTRPLNQSEIERMREARSLGQKGEL